MKKITPLLLLLFIGFANAQDNNSDSDSDKLSFAKGSKFLNLNVSVISESDEFTSQGSTDESKLFGFSVIPSYAYAISDNWFLGLGLGYSSSNSKIQFQGSPEREDTRRGFEVFPFVRYYKGIGKQLAFFVQGEARFSTQKTKIANTNEQKSNFHFVGLRPGFMFKLNKNIFLETSIGTIGYTSVNSSDSVNSYEANSNRFVFSLDASNILFGLNYNF